MKQSEKLPLPIDSFIPGIVEKVAQNETVLVKASPGSGKTTRLPWALSQRLSSRVFVLEPRRLAAKLAAKRISEEENLTLGAEIGYHFRFEKKLSHETKVRFYTEGTFLKLIQDKNALLDGDIVILDEFHERHLDTDLALAFLRGEMKEKKIKLVLMSATLDLELASALNTNAIVEIEVAHFPVTIKYLPNQPSILNQSIEQKVKRAVEETEGDTLVFLPGMREILRVQETLSGFHTFILHGELERENQDEALKIYPFRKIILSTNIAESSVTIPGIKTVIDSGIQRNAHYSAWNGLKILKDDPVTKSSAIQRAGRAGRTGPGTCHRLYAEMDFNERSEHTVPELFRADLTDVFLQVKASSLLPEWFQAPPVEQWKKAGDLLLKLGAVTPHGITAIGRKMLELPLDARLARALVSAENAVSQEKEKLLRYICQEIEDDRTGLLRNRLRPYLRAEGTDRSSWEKYLLSGFIDQVAKFRQKQKDFIHYSGKIIKAHPTLSDLQDGYFIVIDITQKQEAIQVVPIEEEWLWEIDPFPFTEDDEIRIDEKISFRRKTLLGRIVVEESATKLNWPGLSDELRKKLCILADSTFRKKLSLLDEDSDVERLNYWARQKNLELSSLRDSLTVADYFHWNDELSFENVKSFFSASCQEKLDLTLMDQELPKTINLGGRRELVVHYPAGMDPYLEAPIQDFYGINETPSIMRGKVPLQLKLLGPHKRPIQVTKDLKNFWVKTYQEMKKEYQRDYPRHYWPDRPWEAKPVLLKSHLPKV